MRKRVPSYRHHKPSGKAVVTVNGRDYYLGKYNSRESKAAYDKLIREWRAAGQSTCLGSVGGGITINLLVAASLCDVCFRRECLQSDSLRARTPAAAGSAVHK